ncbi:peptidase [Microbacterium gorillae]|uniref:peptidase n=1 Tax=Microbacterium gorillae TaxID=1231063 RepID=UPI000A62D6C2|nr:peptidase [Microbacterium gorillae]
MIEIDWKAFFDVFVVALIGASALVFFYAVGLRLLVLGGRAPVVSPAEFTDAITVITEKEAQRAQRAAVKAAKKNPLTDGQKRWALVGAYGCFAMCGVAVIVGVLLLLVK